MVDDPYIVKILIKPMVKYGTPSMHSRDTSKDLEVAVLKKKEKENEKFHNWVHL
jgi:hypothetical protein